MRRRPILVLTLLVAVGAAAAFGVTRWRHNVPPVPPSPTALAPATPPPETAPTPEPPKSRVSAVELRRGDNLVRALVREGVDHRVGNDIAAALRRSGANLRKLTPRHTLEITWDLNGEPLAVHYEPSPWLGYAVVSSDGAWEVRRS